MSSTQTPRQSSSQAPGHGSDRELGPQRFQRPTDADAGGSSRGRAVLAGLALLALVVGVPAALISLGGLPPIPTSLPSMRELARSISADALVGVLLWVVWLAWLQFTICVLVELRSAIRGIGLPSRVPLGGASQRFARVLVGSVLIAATTVGQANAAVAPTMGTDDAPSTASAMAEATAEVEQQQAERSAEVESAASETSDAGEVTYRLGDMTLDPEDAKDLVGKKVYVVQPPDGRYHDNMWDIAERTLGEGRRYTEIFELNRGREQPDGHELDLARLIYPNWLLIVPNDAKGVDTVEEVRAEPASAPTGTTPGSTPAEQPIGQSGDPQATDSTPGTELAGGSTVGAESTRMLPEDLLGTGLLAVGLLAAVDAVRRRRRVGEPDPDGVDAEVALRIGADPDRVRLLDHALRRLAQDHRDVAEGVPSVYAAVVGDTQVELRLAPARREAPSPWEVRDEGRTWVLDRGSLTGERPDALAPFPGLVSLGRDHADRDVLVDLEAAGGPIEVVGEPGVAVEVVSALAAELATNRWSDRLQVTGYALPSELDVLDRIRAATDLGPTVAEIRRRLEARGAEDVLTGRLRGAAADWAPEFLALGAQPAAAELDEILALTGGAQRSALGVVVAGAVPGARWSLRVDASGSMEIPLLSLSVRANRLSGRSAAAIASLVAPPSPGPDGPDGPASERPAVPAPGRAVSVAEAATAPVLVTVFAEGAERAPGPMEPERVELSTEIVVHLALERGGVHPTVLAAAIWPGGVTTAVQNATIERVRTWLGDGPDGSPHLRQAPDGRLSLGPDVAVDVDVALTLLQRSRRVATPSEEVDLLRQALRTAHAPIVESRARGRYSWMARVRLERSLNDLVVDAAHRLAVLSNENGDPGGAGAAARAGLRVRPGEEGLWRDLIKAEYATAGADGVRRVVREMSSVLSDLGVIDWDAKTVTLLDELIPGGSGDPATGLSGTA